MWFKVLIRDPAWFCKCVRFYRNQPWRSDSPKKTGFWRALLKLTHGG